MGLTTCHIVTHNLSVLPEEQYMKASVPDIVKSLQLMGFLAVLLAGGFLMGTSVIESDIYLAFCLGAFFTCVIGIIMLFGFSKIILLLGEIRDKTEIINPT